MDGEAGQTVHEFSRIHKYFRRNSGIRGYLFVDGSQQPGGLALHY